MRGAVAGILGRIAQVEVVGVHALGVTTRMQHQATGRYGAAKQAVGQTVAPGFTAFAVGDDGVTVGIVRQVRREKTGNRRQAGKCRLHGFLLRDETENHPLRFCGAEDGREVDKT